MVELGKKLVWGGGVGWGLSSIDATDTLMVEPWGRCVWVCGGGRAGLSTTGTTMVEVCVSVCVCVCACSGLA